MLLHLQLSFPSSLPMTDPAITVKFPSFSSWYHIYFKFVVVRTAVHRYHVSLVLQPRLGLVIGKQRCLARIKISLDSVLLQAACISSMPSHHKLIIFSLKVW